MLILALDRLLHQNFGEFQALRRFFHLERREVLLGDLLQGQGEAMGGDAMDGDAMGGELRKTGDAME